MTLVCLPPRRSTLSDYTAIMFLVFSVLEAMIAHPQTKGVTSEQVLMADC